MHRHATMNRFYRLIWSEVLGSWIAVAEHARARGKGAARKLALAALLAGGGSVWAGPPAPTQTPTGAQIVAGQVSVQQSAAHTEVTQASQRGIVEWQGFNVGAQASVNFAQPSASAVTLNRVLDSQASQVFGKVTANGQVFLVNPNGVVFGPGASVDVGGLVATTHSISNSDFMAGNNRFTRNGAIGSVLNQGSLNAALGGYVALLAPEVRNSGVVVAQAGTVALAAGEAITLQIQGGTGLAGVTVEASTMNALVENRQAVRAPGGLIILSAQAANSLLGGVVNNSGSLEATGVVRDGGRVMLMASERITLSGSINADAAPGSSGKGGTVSVIASLENPTSTTRFDGSISARGGALGGDGGFVETSASKLTVGDTARVDTTAPRGTSGMWLLDPADYTIGGSNGNVSGSTLGNNLQSSDITILSSQGTDGGGNTKGDILVNESIFWSSANTLTLSALRHVQLNNADIKNIPTGAAGKLVLRADNGGACVAGASNCGTVNFSGSASISAPLTEIYTNAPNSNAAAGTNGTGPSYATAPVIGPVTGTLKTYLLVNDVNQLQAINTRLGGTFALGRNIDASAAIGWNVVNGSAQGFSPIGLQGFAGFSGVLDGLGHTISNLPISLSASTNVGLISINNTAGVVRNLNLAGGSVTGKINVGALAGTNNGSIDGVNSSAKVTAIAGGALQTGGLVGANTGTIATSSSSGIVTGVTSVGGLAGFNSKTINGSYATGEVTGTGDTIGGLTGINNTGSTIDASYATGKVSGAGNVGGLVGIDNGNVKDSHASGAVTGTTRVGGLVGWVGVLNPNGTPTVSGSYATGVVTGAQDTGGLVGYNSGTITKSYTSGAVGSGANTGGLAGTNAGDINISYASGAVTGTTNVGGLVGNNQKNISNTYAVGAVSGANIVGGLVGNNNGPLTTSFSAGTVSVSPGGSAGGFIGAQPNETLATDSYWDTTTAGQTQPIGNQVSSRVSGRSTAQMKQSAMYGDAGWDFAIWNLNGVTNTGYPYLLGVFVPITDSVLHVKVLGTFPGSVYGDPIAAFVAALFSGSTQLDNPTLASLGLQVSGVASLNVPPANSLPGIYTPSYSGGLTLGGVNAPSYSVVTDPPTTYTISKRPLVLEASRAYDGKTQIDKNIVIAKNLVTGTCVSGLVACGLDGATAAANANVGSSALDLSTLILGGQIQAGYTLTGASSGTAIITAAPLTVTSMTASDKVYDGGILAALNGGSLSGLANGESLSFTGATGAFGNKDVAPAAKSVTVTGLTLVDSTTAKASNYTVSNPTGLTATILPKAVTVVGMSASDKTYDGAVLATLNGGTVTGTVTGETLGFNGAAGAFSDANAASGKAVTVSGVKLVDGSGQASNYTVSNPAGLKAAITPRTVSVDGMSASDKVYDGVVLATLNGGTVTGMVTGETLGFTGAAGAFSDANAASGKAVTVSGVKLVDGSGQASNYTVSNPAGLTASITPKILSVTGMTANDKDYDGTIAATLNAASLNGLVGNETLGLNANGNFAGKNVGSDKLVVVTGVTLVDGTGMASNYRVINPTGQFTAAIRQKALSIEGMSASDKIYDGAILAALNDGTLTGMVAGETLSFTGASGAFSDKNAAAGKAVTVTGVTLVDGTGQASNYKLDNPTGLKASITPRSLTVDGMSAGDKTYDGAVLATLNGGTLSGMVNDETLSFAGASGAFSDKNVALGKTVTVTGVTLVDGSGLASNYTVSNPAGLKASIVPKILGVTGMSANNKDYDGTTAATLNAAGLSGLVGSETLGLTANGNFAGKNVGSDKLVVVTGVTLVDGTGMASNYRVINPTGQFKASINQKALTITGMGASDKVYDGAVLATLNGGTLSGVVNGETLSFTGAAGAFADKNAGVAKPVTVSGVSLTGTASGNASNYTVSNPTGLKADINPLALPVQGVLIADKTYDGNVAAGIITNGTISTLKGDSVLLSGANAKASFVDSSAGIDKPVIANGYTVSGADAANYQLLQPVGLRADITPAPPTQVVAPANLSVTCTNLAVLPAIDPATGQYLTSASLAPTNEPGKEQSAGSIARKRRAAAAKFNAVQGACS